MPNNSEIVDDVLVKLKNGQVTEAVETLLKGRKKYSCRIAILSSMITESLIRNNEIQELKFFISKLEHYHSHNMHY
jgi:hypothetical protein